MPGPLKPNSRRVRDTARTMVANRLRWAGMRGVMVLRSIRYITVLFKDRLN
jgi:hypothetical protein